MLSFGLVPPLPFANVASNDDGFKFGRVQEPGSGMEGAWRGEADAVWDSKNASEYVRWVSSDCVE